MESAHGPIQPEDYTVVFIRQPDKIVLVNAHPPVVQVVRTVLGGFIQNESSQSRMAVTFKLHGNMFMANQSLFGSSEESYTIKRTLGILIQRLQAIGWILLITSDLGKEFTNSALFFRRVIRQNQNGGPLVSIAPSSRDKMFLIDMPRHIEVQLTNLVKTMWGLQNRQVMEEGDNLTTELKMSNNPWHLGGWFTGAGEDGVRLRQLLMEMIRVMRRYNYDLVANISTKGTTDSLFFQHNENLYGSPEDMFIMSLNNDDKIRFITAPEYIIRTAGEVIRRDWRKGVQREGDYCGAHEFKLSGNPWWASGEETVESRYLVGSLLSQLKAQGWEVGATLDVARKMQDKTVFIMRQCPPSRQDFAVIGFHENDKIRLIGGGPENEKLKDLIQGIIGFQGNVQRTRVYGRSFKWKVSGNPFWGSFAGDQRIMFHLLTKILRQMNLSGWKLVASADVSAKYQNQNNKSPQPLDTHSWFFLKDPEDVLPPGAVAVEVRGEWSGGEAPEIMNEQESCGGAARNWIFGGVTLVIILAVILFSMRAL